jgi:hypothetical protein
MNSGHSAMNRHIGHAIGGTARSWAPDHGEGTPCPARCRRVGLAGPTPITMTVNHDRNNTLVLPHSGVSGAGHPGVTLHLQ